MLTNRSPLRGSRQIEHGQLTRSQIAGSPNSALFVPVGGGPALT